MVVFIRFQMNVASIPTLFKLLNTVKLVHIFGSVAKVDMLATLFCLQRFKVCDSTLARSNCFKCVLGLRELNNNEWKARVKSMNGSPTVLKH